MSEKSQREPYVKPQVTDWSFVISSALAGELWDLRDEGKSEQRILEDIRRVFVMWEVRHGGQGPG